jgi:hypothetical protein
LRVAPSSSEHERRVIPREAPGLAARSFGIVPETLTSKGT